MDRDLFLEKVTKLFLVRGPKTLTMDDIAKEFSMSKKTLYQLYPNKEELLTEVMVKTLECVMQGIKQKNETCKNPVAFFIDSEQNFENLMVEIRDSFILQMVKYYPEILKAHTLKVYEELNGVFSQKIAQGRKLGVFREDFDEHMYAKFFIQLCSSADESPLFQEEIKNRIEFRTKVADFYLNAILTEKGKQNFKELKKNDKKN